MRVAVTGGTGYAGPAVVEELLRAGHEVVALEHRRPVDVESPRLRRVQGDVLDLASLQRAFEGADAVAHLVAIIRERPGEGVTFERAHVEATRNVVLAAREAGARRLLLMSANGVGDPSMPDTPYFRTKAEMERLAKESGLEWTIFRPSFIAGSREGGFDHQFAGVVDRFPVLPSFAGGRFDVQPVSRRDVGLAFARALERPASIGKTYVLAGPERMTWNAYLARLSRVRGRRRAIAYVPGWAILLAARRMPGVFPIPVDPDQLRMLMAGNVGDASEAARDLGIEWEPWERAVEGLRADRPAGRLERTPEAGRLQRQSR